MEASWAFLLPFPWVLSALWLIERRRIGPAAVLDPGSAASIAATVFSICIFVYSIHLVVRISAIGSWTHADLWADVVIYLLDPRAYAAAAIVSWLILRLDGRWVTSPSLLDRFGRLIGFYWILSALAMLAINIWNNWRL